MKKIEKVRKKERIVRANKFSSLILAYQSSWYWTRSLILIIWLMIDTKSWHQAWWSISSYSNELTSSRSATVSIYSFWLVDWVFCNRHKNAMTRLLFSWTSSMIAKNERFATMKFFFKLSFRYFLTIFSSFSNILYKEV